MPSSTLPTDGSPAELESEGSLSLFIQSAAAADGNGSTANVDGYAGALTLEIQKTGTGATNLNVEGSFDGSTWYAAGYQQIDNTLAPSRAVAAIPVTAGAFNHVYSILDTYPQIRARLSGTAGTISLQARIYALPV